MLTTRFLPLAIFVASVALALPSPCLADVWLGDAPTAPSDVSGLPTGPRVRSVTGGFTVNIDSREEVRSFYNAVYRSSDGVAMNTSANVAACFPGTNGTLFKESVLRRINWFRAMAGVPAAVTFDASFNTNDQLAAVMMSANTNLSHTPPSSWFCWTASGSNAANNSNLALGNAGADAITAYIWDFGANNTAVGHRRWILLPQTQVMGTGDVPKQGNFSPANATWIFDGNLFLGRPATRKPYVSWPPAGYVPYQVVYPQWSFALSTNDLSGATVSMKSNGVNVAVSMQPYQTNIGENTRAWVPIGLDATSASTVFPFNGTDTVYTVTITNIPFGLSMTGYTYTVTLFDPAVPGPDYQPPTISGPSQPVVGQNNGYTCTPITNATSYEWRVTIPSPFSFSDGAESGLGNWTANTTAGYSVQDSSQHATGSFSFLLAHPAPATLQTLTLNQVFVPKTNGSLAIKNRLGYAANGETARIQVSTDGGVAWQDIATRSGVGDGTTAPVDSGFVSTNVSLASFTGSSIRLRFAYTYTSGLFYINPQGGFPVGWYLDDIVITNAEVWTLVSTNTTATTNFTFNPSQATNYNLNVRANIFTEFPLEYGPVRNVVATTNAPVVPPVITLSKPVITGGNVLLDFTVTSGSSATFKLLQADQVTGPWATNGTAVLTTNVPGSSYRFTSAVGPARRFYRVQAP